VDDKVKDLLERAGFHMRPHIEGVQGGVDWTAASWGYDECLERLVHLTVLDCLAVFCHCMDTRGIDLSINPSVYKALKDTETHFGIK
jgi:hypothetical protein